MPIGWLETVQSQGAFGREAVAELEAVAAGRADLLAGAAGSILGGYLSSPGTTQPQLVYAVAMLVIAAADVDLIVERVDRARSTTARRGIVRDDSLPPSVSRSP